MSLRPGLTVTALWLLAACSSPGGTDASTPDVVAEDHAIAAQDAPSTDAVMDAVALDVAGDAPGDAMTVDDTRVLDSGLADTATTDAASDATSTTPDASPDASCPVASSTQTLGAAASSLAPPAMAHHVSGATLFVWLDDQRQRADASLREAAGTMHDLGDLGGYATDPTRAPYSSATVIATPPGFEALWIETTTTSGVTSYHFRHAFLMSDGSSRTTSTFTPALAIHYIDVAPRLFWTASGTVLVYLGRTSDALPATRLVFVLLDTTGMPTADGFTAMSGTPAQVCWDGTAFARVSQTGSVLSIDRVSLEGATVTPAVTVTPPTGAAGSLRIAPASRGYFLSQGTVAWYVDPSGASSASSTVIPNGATLDTHGDEAFIMARSAAINGWRLDTTGHAIAYPGLFASTGFDGSFDAAAWTGTQWLFAFSDMTGLNYEPRWGSLCE